MTSKESPPPSAPGNAVDEEARQPPVLPLGSAAELVQALLFVQEFGSVSNAARVDLSPIRFFLDRKGGTHLLLLLLNAAYQKPQLGRNRSWPFGVLAARVKVSERCLRQLLGDAVSRGLISKRSSRLDKRRHGYYLTPQVIASWDYLFEALTGSLCDVFETLKGDGLADIDYSIWDPDAPARRQKPLRAVFAALRSAQHDPAYANRGRTYDRKMNKRRAARLARLTEATQNSCTES